LTCGFSVIENFQGLGGAGCLYHVSLMPGSEKSLSAKVELI
jgi:hypothetical protein